MSGPLPETLIASSSWVFFSSDGTAFSAIDEQTEVEIVHDFQLGTLIHERYLLTSSLGQGSMGCVFLAHDQLLNRQVAMKVVAVRSTRNHAVLQEALAREARLGASLNDPGIAAVYDFGVHAGKSFTIFEYVSGETLRQLLTRYGQLPLTDVQQIIGSLARSLDSAHARGVIHRDLKPENICITRQGQPKILDFGIARDLRQDFRQEGFCGTPQYAAPEQAACSATDSRTDQYALGLIAWEMLTGQRVFQAASANEVLRMHRECEPVNLSILQPDIGESTSAAVHRALLKDPAKRFATCQEFANTLMCQQENVTGPRVRLTAKQNESKSAYLCHVGEDSLLAGGIASSLEIEGYSTWYYQRDAVSRLPFLQQVSKAAGNCTATVLLISAAALRSDDFAAEVSEASQYGCLLIPVLYGMTIDEFEIHQPAWRPLLGATIVREAATSSFEDSARFIIELLNAGGVTADAPVNSDVNAKVSTVPGAKAITGQAWATDASQIDIPDLRHVVFRNPQVDDFLQRRNKCFLVGTKGQGKTLLLTYKRHLLSQVTDSRENERGLCFVPQGRPYLDFMSELRTLSARFEKPLSELSTCKRFWTMALRVSAVSNHPGVISVDEDAELEIFPPRFQRWLRGQKIEPTVVFKELTNLSISQANALVDDSETFLDQKLRSIHSSTYFFIDKVDQAVRRLSRQAWISIQAGLIEAAWDLMSANSHVKVFASIRQEAFVNYQSDIKANLFGATTLLGYTDEELENLMDRLCGCYESSLGFKDFLGIRVIKHPRRPVPEDSFDFIRRHAFGRPRDLVVIASELSSQKRSLSETRYCEIVRRASATHLVPGIFEEMNVFLDCLGDPPTRVRFLETLEMNILSRQDAVTACARFNGISDDAMNDLGHTAAELFHPFQDLYLAGLLGVVESKPDSDEKVQAFRRPDDLVNCLGMDLPDSSHYLLHPALSIFIRELKRSGRFTSMEHIVVGDRQPWQPWDDVFFQIEHSLIGVTDEDLRQDVHRLLKRSREILRSSTPRNLSLILQAMPDWHSVQSRLTSQGYDDAVLWLDELKCKPW